LELPFLLFCVICVLLLRILLLDINKLCCFLAEDSLFYVHVSIGPMFILNFQVLHTKGWRPLLPYGYIYIASCARPD